MEWTSIIKSLPKRSSSSDKYDFDSDPILFTDGIDVFAGRYCTRNKVFTAWSLKHNDDIKNVKYWMIAPEIPKTES